MIEKTTDWLDAAAAQTERERDVGVASIREAASKIPQGEPGECDLCGEHSLRLVNGACAPCRDRHKLP